MAAVTSEVLENMVEEEEKRWLSKASMYGYEGRVRYLFSSGWVQRARQKDARSPQGALCVVWVRMCVLVSRQEVGQREARKS